MQQTRRRTRLLDRIPWIKLSARRAEEVFAALAHPSRRHILLTLQFRGGEMTPGEIAERFGCRRPTTTRHLDILRKAKLISVVSRGRKSGYTRLEAIDCAW